MYDKTAVAPTLKMPYWKIYCYYWKLQVKFISLKTQAETFGFIVVLT